MIPSHYPGSSTTSQQPAGTSSYYEPYGEVKTPAIALTSSSVAQRRAADTASPGYPTYFTPRSPNSTPIGLRPAPTSDLYSPSTTTYFTTSPFHQKLAYQHNTPALSFLLPPLLALMWLHASPYPLQAFLLVGLCLYGLDLANVRQGAAFCIWIGFGVLLCVSGWFILLDEGDDEDSGAYIMGLLLRVGVNSLLFFCLACWCTLQFQWLYVGDDRETAAMMETLLHSMLPPVSASIACFQLASSLADSWGLDRAATLAPYLFAILLACGMLWLGCAQSSFYNLPNDSTDKRGWTHYSVTSVAARMHSSLLLLVPPVMHVLTFRRRIISSNASFDDAYDLILAWVFPYLLHYLIHMLHHSEIWKGPYAMSNIFFPTYGNTLRGVLVPMAVTVLASLAVQQRYLIPLCHSVAYQFNGHDQSSNTIVSAFLSLATLSSLMAIWVWGRKSVQTGEPVFGEYHEDVVQLLLALSGFLVGKAFGMPWNLTPLPILAFLGLSVWATTRMLRYLAIFLFVLHAAGMVLLSYRFAGIDSKVSLALPWFQLTLIRFGMVIVFASILIGFVMGLSVRSSGGLGSSLLKRVDLAGVLLIVYTIVLTTLEVTLLKQPAPFQELANIDIDETDSNSNNDTIYDHVTALLTGSILIGITLFMQKYTIISLPCSAVVLSVSIGKLFAVFIDMYPLTGDQTKSQVDSAGPKMLFQMAVASLLCLVIVSPRAFLKPVYVKAPMRNKHALGHNGQTNSNLPFNASVKVWIYALVILPFALVASVPYLLLPLSEVISGHYSGTYYSVAPSISEVAGLALSLWGLACLSMLNHLLPDAGGEGWKKASAFTFLMGVGIALSAPTLPNWIGLDSRNASHNPFASISSLGHQLVMKDRSRIGGWGLVFSSLATLLAITGPLELQERRLPSGKKDNFLMLRLMIFSIMFGCGASWFITILNMSEEKMAVILVTSIGCMAMSFFGTVAAVLGYFVELENFEEVESVALICGIGFPVFGLIAGIPQLMLGDAAHPFGTGGWLSTYLVVTGCTALGFSLVLRSRTTKNTTSRGQSNLGAVVAWLCAVAVLYGRYGVAGLDVAFEVTKIFGVPVSVMGTFLASPILFLLEGEGSSERRGRVQRLNAAPPKPSQSPLLLTLPQLNRTNQLAPLFSGTVLVLLIASLHAILLRGSGWFFLGGSRIPKSQEDVFSMLYGSSGVGAEVVDLARRTILHSQALRTSARLAASGIWTTSNFLVPLLHLGAVGATFPSLYFIHKHLWIGQRPTSSAQVVAAALFNLIPLSLCWGVPSLLAVAILGLIGSILQLLLLQQRRQNSQMRI